MEPAVWALIALREGPREIPMLFDAMRALDGPIGHGTLFATVARLERLDLVERTDRNHGRGAYRLTDLGAFAAGSVAALNGEARS
jgi:DNA-binding HxlR family transcriptional regulator